MHTVHVHMLVLMQARGHKRKRAAGDDGEEQEESDEGDEDE